ncbi:MAG: DUF2007 domain-containing protein [Planctomycetes bacterium]|nr:DUF2007 domain-containing protein [Planctomycetota bacterium]
MSEHMLVEVFRAKDNPQALVMRQALEELGISASIDNELLQGAVGELPVGWATCPRIMVAATDVPRARAILARSERTKSSAPADSVEEDEIATCLVCGERLPEEDGSCPACGWSYNSGEAEGVDA